MQTAQGRALQQRERLQMLKYTKRQLQKNFVAIDQKKCDRHLREVIREINEIKRARGIQTTCLTEHDATQVSVRLR